MYAADQIAQYTLVANVAIVGPIRSPHMPTQGSKPFIPSAVYTFSGHASISSINAISSLIRHF